MEKTLRKISADEFARRLRQSTGEQDKRFAFFIGAGCSVSSGIPGAHGLVKDKWLPRLRDLLAPNRKDLDTWAKEEIPGYDTQNPAASYGPVMERLFLQPEERQRELESLCEGRFPGFGYAVLANLLEHQGGCFNVALTTNFDDLMPDALYLFTQARPLTIQHESLAQFIRPTRTRPLIVKLHGDHRLSPLNTSHETERLKEDIGRQVAAVLNDRGLIFIGYGGNDQGIRKMLDGLPAAALPLGVFWVSGAEPQGEIRPWLESREAIWVEKHDFDELMLLIRDVFDLPHPERKRFDEVFEKYTETYKKLSTRVATLPDTAPDAAALKEAVERADEAFPNWVAPLMAAYRLHETDPDRADAIYAEGIEQFPDSAVLLGSYASFLKDVRKDYDRAEEYFRRALDADPGHASILGNYAILLNDVRKDYDRVEEYYRRALIADPDHANNLGNYAGFLLARGRSDQGLQMLDEVFRLPDASVSSSLAVETRFYAFAHRLDEGRTEAFQNLKRVLEAGARSPGWNLEDNIARAREDEHPDIEWLEKLAAVITENADIAILDEWPAWQEV